MTTNLRNKTIAGLAAIVMLSTSCAQKSYSNNSTTKKEQPTIKITTIFAIPTSRVERSSASHRSAGSYTFPFKTSDGEVGLAYRSGEDINFILRKDVFWESHGSVETQINRLFEYETLMINRAYDEQRKIVFQSKEKTPEGSYLINDWTILNR